jgi:hypothetical protein
MKVFDALQIQIMMRGRRKIIDTLKNKVLNSAKVLEICIP